MMPVAITDMCQVNILENMIWNIIVLLVISDWDYALYGNVDGYVSTQYAIKHHYYFNKKAGIKERVLSLFPKRYTEYSL